MRRSWLKFPPTRIGPLHISEDLRYCDCSCLWFCFLTLGLHQSLWAKALLPQDKSRAEGVVSIMSDSESGRAAKLQDAQDKASALFEEIGRSLIRPDILESALSKENHQLGTDRYNVRTHWHKRVVRSGPNTLQPYSKSSPDCLIEEDDILFIDFGPVFEE